MTSVHSNMCSFANAVQQDKNLPVAVSVTRTRGRFARFQYLSRRMPSIRTVKSVVPGRKPLHRRCLHVMGSVNSQAACCSWSSALHAAAVEA